MSNTLEINTEIYGKLAEVTVVGRVDSSTSPQLDDKLKELADEKKSHIILDLSQVSFLSSAGLRAVVSSLRTSRKIGGNTILLNPSERVLEVLQLAGLDSVIDIYHDKQEALDSFGR
ncbi:MAG: STAS domain-containing protein [Ardenticatenaceae bacterium]|nr:STAS domain-containing protein [Anaerolineales bacterium]MCB8918149.1 STAS domain-containing protein [Ardenticatenaceae bacterium]